MPTAYQDLFAAIDLGSNSFHMLVVRQIAGGVQTLAKIKRKVRLAAGLDAQMQLSDEAMVRGLDCLRLFAERLQDIKVSQIKVVATATIRAAANREQFLHQAAAILGTEVEVISGEQEAALIYAGAAYTSAGDGRRLVIDIGGASTELIVGAGFDAEHLISLPMGCVLFRERYFANGQLSEQGFAAAIQAASDIVAPHLAAFTQLGWQRCLGASGTIQAVQEVLLSSGWEERISLDRLQQLKHACIEAGQLDTLKINGLLDERKPVFASGLAILIALFQSLGIEYLQLAGGALREGLVYRMLDARQHCDVRQHTLQLLKRRYRVDEAHAIRVSTLCLDMAAQVQPQWALAEYEAEVLLSAAAQLTEVGLLIAYKQAHLHGRYVISHSDMPGFSPAQRRVVAELIGMSQQPPEPQHLAGLNGYPSLLIEQLLRLLRLAVILAGRRQDSALPAVSLSADGQALTLCLPASWLSGHPLIAAELAQESTWLAPLGWPLQVTTTDEISAA